MPPFFKAPMTAEQREMLQSLLLERFHLQYRRETRDGPVYVLTRGNKPLKMTDLKDKNEYPWAGGPGGGGLMGDGLKGINESMDDLAWRLSPYLGRPVLNRTEISGSYDFLADYPLEDGRGDIIGMILATVKDVGLKLEAAKGPIETIVIEHAEKPSAINWRFELDLPGSICSVQFSDYHREGSGKQLRDASRHASAVR